MEAYRTKCRDTEKCGFERIWTGYKTGIGKTPEQLAQMEKDQTTCIKCNGLADTHLDGRGLVGSVESYLNCRRPPILEAIKLEGDVPVGEAVELLRKKGYFTPQPRPWQLGYKDRELGRRDYVVLDAFGDLVAEVKSKDDAELIILAVNEKEY